MNANTYKLDIYKVIEGTDNWPKVATVYGETEQECLDEANRYDQDEYHWTNPIEAGNEAAVALGSMTSAKKAKTSAENGRKSKGRPSSPVSAWASNDQGASTDVGEFLNVSRAVKSARENFGSGWTIHIMRDHEEIKRFRIR